MSLRQTIHEAKDYEKEEVKVPEWGVTVYIRSMTARHADDMQIRYLRMRSDDSFHEGKIKEPEVLRDLKVIMVSYCLADEYGALLFDDDEGREILRGKSSAVIDHLYEIAAMLNKMTDEAIDTEKKDLEPMTSTDSNSLSA